MPADGFGQAALIEDQGRLEEAPGQVMHQRVEAVALETEGDGPVLRGPDRAQVVGEGVVGGVKAGEGADSPAREHVGGHQAAGDGGRLVLVDDAAGEAMAHVGGDGGDLAFLRVEGQGQRALREPERLVEAFLEGLGLANQLEASGDLSHGDEGLSHELLGDEVVALDLDGGDGVGDAGAVGVEDGLAGVLPALVLGAPVPGPGLVLVEAVAVAIPLAVHPVEDAQGVRLHAALEVAIAREHEVPAETDQEQARPRVVPVIVQEGGFAQQGEGAELVLVDDPAGLLVVTVVSLSSEPVGDGLQGTAQHEAADEAGLPGRGQGIAAEERLVHGDAGRRRVNFGAFTVEEGERAEIRARPFPGVLDHRRRGLEAGGLPDPGLAGPIPGGFPRAEGVALVDGIVARTAEDRVHLHAELEGSLGLQAQPVADLASVPARRTLHQRKADARLVVELGMLVAKPQLAFGAFRMPADANRSLLEAPAFQRFGEIGEIGGEVPKQRDLGGDEGVVGQVDVGMEAVSDVAVELERDRLLDDLTPALRRGTGLGSRGGGRQVVRDEGVGIDRIGRDEAERLAVHREVHALHEAGLMKVEAVDALANPAVDSGDQERMALIRDQGFRKHLETVDVLEQRASLPSLPPPFPRDPLGRRGKPPLRRPRSY
ncbi:hypothetical protein D3C87_1026670 [compost metagenome]